MTGSIKYTTTNYELGIPYFDRFGWGTEMERNLIIIDGVMFAISQFTGVRGTWTNNTSYEVRDRVTDPDLGTIYECLIAHTSASSGSFEEDRINNPSFWEEASLTFENRGQWLTNSVYNYNNLVTDGNRIGIVVVQSYLSGDSYDDDVLNGQLITIIDLSSQMSDSAQAVIDAEAARDLAQSYAEAAEATVQPASQCYLYKEGTSLRIIPQGGNLLTIQGQARQIPVNGVNLAASGLAPNTVYFIYASWTGSAIELVPSTDTSVISSMGLLVRGTNANQTLVGMAVTDGSSLWADDNGTRIGVVSYYNRRRKTATKSFTANRTVSAGGGTAEINSEIRTFFLSWSDEDIRADAIGGWAVAGAGNAYAHIRYDGTGFAITRSAENNSTFTTGLGLVATQKLPQGIQHYVTLFANMSGGTSVTFLGGGNGAVSLSVEVMG